jgi:hypothetical protein
VCPRGAHVDPLLTVPSQSPTALADCARAGRRASKVRFTVFWRRWTNGRQHRQSTLQRCSRPRVRHPEEIVRLQDERGNGLVQRRPSPSLARSLGINGATRIGNTWLAYAVTHEATRSGLHMLRVSAVWQFDELQFAYGDGGNARRLAELAKVDLPQINDFTIAPIGAVEDNGFDLLEVGHQPIPLTA